MSDTPLSDFERLINLRRELEQNDEKIAAGIVNKAVGAIIEYQGDVERLTAERDALKGEVKHLVGLLKSARNFSHHSESCEVEFAGWQDDDLDDAVCDCGFDALDSAIENAIRESGAA